MLKWNIGANPICVLCQKETETISHLFFKCCYSGAVWEEMVRKLLGLKFVSDWESVLRLLTDRTIEKRVLFLFRYSFQMIVHAVWIERNGRKHGEPSTSSNQLVKVLEKNVRNRLSSIRMLGDVRFESHMEVWLNSR